jgi:hypothetical protein
MGNKMKSTDIKNRLSNMDHIDVLGIAAIASTITLGVSIFYCMSYHSNDNSVLKEKPAHVQTMNNNTNCYHKDISSDIFKYTLK